MSKISFRKNSVLSHNPQFRMLLLSIFWKFVKKWCGLKVNNYGNSFLFLRWTYHYHYHYITVCRYKFFLILHWPCMLLYSGLLLESISTFGSLGCLVKFILLWQGIILLFTVTVYSNYTCTVCKAKYKKFFSIYCIM